MRRFESVDALVGEQRPEKPVLCLRPHAAGRAASWFRREFPGAVLYALKANDAPVIVDALFDAGIRRFDVASISEMRSLAHLDGVELSLMHPVKSRETIRAAYFEYGVRTFALDTAAELAKIVEATGGADDLTLFVRLSCSNADSLIPLEGKFGIDAAEAPALLRHVRRAARRLGVTFHVGSQSMVPDRFHDALTVAGSVLAEAGVAIEQIDVGGGFPSCYPGIEPPPLSHYIDAIERGRAALPILSEIALSCEPGRALVAEAESVLVRVEGRRGNGLYINDGAFGTLYDAAHSGFSLPVRLAGPGSVETASEAFTFYGPTCDSADMMPGPYFLPGSVTEGDYIEIGQIGAYGRTLATRFNGFGRYDEVELGDEPMMTMYPSADRSETEAAVRRKA